MGQRRAAEEIVKDAQRMRHTEGSAEEELPLPARPNFDVVKAELVDQDTQRMRGVPLLPLSVDGDYS